MTTTELLASLPRPFVLVQVSAAGWTSEEWTRALLAAFPERAFVLWGEPNDRAFTQAVACALANAGKFIRTFDWGDVELARGVRNEALAALNRAEALQLVRAKQ